MDRIVGEFYIADNKLHKSSEINYQFNNSEYLVYEVLRCKSGILLFLEDHISRFFNSVRKLRLESSFEEAELQTLLKSLIQNNLIREGNIKFLGKHVAGKIHYAAYYIPHFYPPLEMYQSGVVLTTYMIERNDPNIKQISVNENINRQIKAKRTENNAFEVLLINNQGIITECSKSNFFLISDKSIVSAPGNYILEGVTRKHVLEIAQSLSIKNITTAVKISDLVNYAAAFLCGTSPKIMPVQRIDEAIFNIDNTTVHSLMEEYDHLVNKYYQSHLESNG